MRNFNIYFMIIISFFIRLSYDICQQKAPVMGLRIKNLFTQNHHHDAHYHPH